MDKAQAPFLFFYALPKAEGGGVELRKKYIANRERHTKAKVIK